MDARELFNLWLDKHLDIDFTYEKWAKFLEAHDDFPLFIVFYEGMKVAQRIEVKERLPKMKRYDPSIGFSLEPCMEEDPAGGWIKWEDIKARMSI